ncbi:MAG TPA: uroporphyrinogen decarboxylase, partial [Cytophagaceae bacterium]|nr:uroporphyrinogen decarboxylase [Cytophagaceae bacterium]
MTLKNDLILRAARGEKVERVPVWLMRQAGRILPEYRAVRESVSGFRELVMTPSLAAEVTIQPVDILGVDAAIIFSDILVVPEAMGLPYELVESRGPIFPKTIQNDKDITSLLGVQAADELHYVYDAIRVTKKNLDGRVPLIGFAGAPWTIFAYMIEGQGSKTFSKAKRFLYTEPERAKLVLDKITDATIAYLKRQVEAGADMLQVFDSWASVLNPEQYREFSSVYIERICNELNHVVPLTIFAKGVFSARGAFAKMKCDVIGLDWTMDAKDSRQIIGPAKTLQGNLDPC